MMTTQCDAGAPIEAAAAGLHGWRCVAAELALLLTSGGRVAPLSYAATGGALPYACFSAAEAWIARAE